MCEISVNHTCQSIILHILYVESPNNDFKKCDSFLMKNEQQFSKEG